MAAETSKDLSMIEQSVVPELTRRGRRSRLALVEAAKRVFGSDGFLNARVLDIALEAGLSHGSFYTYFESKEEIFREVIDAVKVDMTRPVSVADGSRRSVRDGAPEPMSST
jgi:AcrR family transcriptional regulator